MAVIAVKQRKGVTEGWQGRRDAGSQDRPEMGSRGEEHASRGSSDTGGHRAQLLRGSCRNQLTQAEAGTVPTPWTAGDQTHRGYHRADSPKPR